MIRYEISRSWREPTRIALIDGNEVAYRQCNEKILTDDHLGEYLGEGVIYSIDGVVQSGKRRYHFWAKPTTTRA